MRIGNIQETVTVTGESPVVDIQSRRSGARSPTSSSRSCRPGGSWIQMAALTSAVRAQNRTSAAFLGDQTGAQVSAHGSREGDGVSMVDGLRIGNMYLSSNLTNMSCRRCCSIRWMCSSRGSRRKPGPTASIMNAIPRRRQPLSRDGADQRHHAGSAGSNLTQR
jgi:hypothetical protein